ncbi:hypothetical protein AB1L88_01730 [Tautonia sp. JC769]|uniref:hypothetical protein n=1 Tax=Tautonia sp. JC769 TaxID=3232135 RepID=UPI00345A9821
MMGAWVLLGVMTLWASQEPATPTDRADFEEVVRRSPVILPTDPGVSSVAFRVGLALPSGAITMRGAFRKPDGVVLVVFDDFDQTPIAWSDGRSVTVYDPVGSRLVLGSTAGVAVRMLQVDDQGTFDVFLAATPEDHRARLDEQGGAFLFDLRSIVEADRRDQPQAERAAGGSLRTRILAPSGRQMTVTIDEVGDATRWAAESAPGPDGSALSLAVLVNGPPDDRLFERSGQRPLIAGLPVVELVDAVQPGGRAPADRLVPITELDRVVLRVVQARAAIRQVRDRDPLTPIIGDLGTQGGLRLLQDQRASAGLRAFWGLSAGRVLDP